MREDAAMAEGAQELRRINWSECFSFTHIFRSFQLAIHPTKLILAFAGILAVYLAGRVLDGIWPATSQPIVTADGSVNEFHYFMGHGDDSAATAAWTSEMAKSPDTKRTGVFEVFLQEMRLAVDGLTERAVWAGPPSVIATIGRVIELKIWMLRMHPVYTIIFGAIWLVVWALCGGAISRIAALHIARDEKIGLRESLTFARSKLGSFVIAPLAPALVLLLGYLVLLLGGLIGAIPAIGEVLTGLLFFIPLLIGFILALVLIGGVAGGWLMYPTIAVEGSDTFDAFSRAYNYVFARPWRTALYAMVALLYGSICIIFVKVLVRIMLFLIHLGLGAGMNIDHVRLTDPAAQTAPKLDAMWKAPTISGIFGGDTPYYGTFEHVQVSGRAKVGRFLLQAWIYGLSGLVGAFAVSFFYSAATMIYFLLRRGVDATDMEDVYLEDADMTASPAAPVPASSGGTSLPVIGQ